MRFYLLLVFVFASGICTLPSAADASSPAWSHGLQILSISVSECGRRGTAALQAEGFSVTNHSGPSEDSFFLGGQRDPHSAIIMCDRSADGRTWVHIVVASVSGDSGVPGAERQRLQLLMNGSAARANCGTIVGTWTWFDGNTVVFNPDGSATHSGGSSGVWNRQADGSFHVHWQQFNTDDYFKLTADGMSIPGTYGGNRTGTGHRRSAC